MGRGNHDFSNTLARITIKTVAFGRFQLNLVNVVVQDFLNAVVIRAFIETKVFY